MAVSAWEIDDDAALVSAVQHGDVTAFAELYRRHFQSVRRACGRRLLDMAEAEEVAQAAFVRAFERIDQCSGPRNFGGWVSVIAQRFCIDARRARARVAPTEEPVPEDQGPLVTGPEDALLDQERSHHIHLALTELPERQRRVVVDRDLRGHRPSEIAAALGVSIGAVDSILLRARRRLAVVYERVAGEQGIATPATTSAASLAGGTALGPAGVAGALGALTAAVRTMEQLAAQVTTAAFAPGASALARRVGAVVAAATLAVAPAATGTHRSHPPASQQVAVPMPPAPTTTLPEPPQDLPEGDLPSGPPPSSPPAVPTIAPTVPTPAPALLVPPGALPTIGVPRAGPSGIGPVDDAAAVAGGVVDDLVHHANDLRIG